MSDAVDLTGRRALMLVQSPVAGDSRVLREAEALAGAGARVHVVGRGVPEHVATADGVTVASVGRSAGLRPGGATGRATGGARGRAKGAAVGAARWLLLPEHRARVEGAWRSGAADQVRSWVAEHGAPDVVHAHDFNTLQLAADVAARAGAALVYDTHEWWSGRLRPGRPTPAADRRQVALERELGARADLVLTVSEAIAGRLRGWGWTRVVVVRNTFPGPVEPPLRRAPSGLLYAGRIGAGRDLPAVLAAAGEVRELRWRLMGSRDEAFLANRELPAGVEVLPATAVDDVDRPLREAGLSLVTLEDSCENHRLALPNKLFHAVRAGVPVVAADLPAIAEVVRATGIGVLYTPGDARSLAAAAREAVRRYPELLDAVEKAQAAGDLAWEVDARVLLEAYAGLRARAGAR